MTTSLLVDPEALRRAFAHYPSGVVALGSVVNGVDEVLVASSFAVGISQDPPLVSFAIQHSSTTWPRLRLAETIGITILGQEQAVLCRQLASRRRDARFDGVDVVRSARGALTITGGAGRLECRIYGQHRAGDHDIVVLEILEIDVEIEREPLVYHGSRFRSLT